MSDRQSVAQASQLAIAHVGHAPYFHLHVSCLKQAACSHSLSCHAQENHTCHNDIGAHNLVALHQTRASLPGFQLIDLGFAACAALLSPGEDLMAVGGTTTFCSRHAPLASRLLPAHA